MNNQLIKIWAIAISGAFFNGATSFVTARSLGPSQFAAFASAVASITILQVFSQGLQFSSRKKFEEKKSKKVYGTSNWILREIIPLTFAVSLFLAIFREKLNFTDFQSIGIASMVIPVLLLSTVSGYYLSNGDLFNYQLVSTQVALIRLTLTVVISFAIYANPSLSGPAVFLIALVVANYLIVLLKFLTLKSRFLLKSLIFRIDSLRYVSILVLSWLLMQGDLLVINIALPPKEAGIYSAYSSLAKVFISFFAIYGLHLSGIYKDKITLRVKMKTLLTSGVAAIILLISILKMGGNVLLKLYGREFDPSLVSIHLLFAPSVLWSIFFGLLYLRLDTISGNVVPIALACLVIASISVLLSHSISASSIYVVYSVAAISSIILLMVSNNEVGKT